MIGGVVSLLVSLAAILVGTVAHFRILAEIERFGVEVKYFANINDNIRAYRTYARLAHRNGWSRWPLYLTMFAYLGLLGAFFTLVLNPAIVQLVTKQVGRR